MESTLFSVLLANYNNSQYIDKAIESVMNQSYANWEIIIVDDSSTDHSLNVLEKYKFNSNIHVYNNKRNRGRGYTKNKCIELAKGEICGFLDTDDMLENNAIETMIRLHKENAECSLIYATLNYFSEENGKIGVPENIGEIPSDLDFCLSKDTIISHFVTFKRNRYFLNKKIDPRLNVGVDVDMYLKLEEVGNILFWNEPLYIYRINNPQSAIRQIKLEQRKISSSKIMLSAICRRINSNSSLFVKNKKLYIDAFKYWLYNNFSRKPSFKNFFYLFIFLKANDFKFKALLDFFKIRIKALTKEDNLVLKEFFDVTKTQLK